MLVLAALVGSAPARAASTPNLPTILQPVPNTTTVTAPNAAISPAEFKAEQASAPDEVVLRVTTVKATPAKSDDDTIGPDAKAIAARAVVLSVQHSRSGLNIGSVIYLLYGYAPPAPGKPGPPPIPIVQQNTDYHAFLSGGPGDTPYHPAAGAQSFLDPKTVDAPAAAASDAKAPPSLADPALLPTPINPRPPGSVHLTGDNLAQFVKLVQTGNQWGASIAHADPLPLLTQGTEPPQLLGYYGKPLGAPAGQPTILIYRASITPAPPPITGNLTSLRALLVNADNRVLGDAPWMRILSDDHHPPLAPYTWTWSAYKVDIDDPDTQKTQTILFVAPTSSNPAAK